MNRPAPRLNPGRIPWPAIVSGLLALYVYGRTLAPGLTWAHSGADGGDLLAAALTRGVPHPTGYPTYELLLQAAIAICPGEPARAGNWLSALCAALAVALLADLARRVLEDVGQVANPPYQPIVGAGPQGFGTGVIALSAALTWGMSPALWGQAVITEVYALNALAVMALCWLLWRWREVSAEGRVGWPWLVGAGLTLGLGLGNHLSLSLTLPGAAVWLWSGRRASQNLVGDALAAAGATALGLAVYAYLPLAAAIQPPINWEDPRTAQQFWRLVSGEIYRDLVFGVPLAYLPGRLAAWASEALRQLGGPWGTLLALAGLWRLDRRQHAWWRATGLTALGFSAYAIGYNTPDSFVYLIPVWGMVALWLAVGLAWLLGGIEQALVRHLGAERVSAAPARALRLALAVLLCLVPAASAARFWPVNDLSHDRAARDFTAQVLADAAPDAVILTAGDERTFALWYAVYGLGLRPDVAPVNVNLVMFDWYRRSLTSRHPDLGAAMAASGPPSLARFLAAVAAQRPLYRAEPIAVDLTEFTETPAGALVRLNRLSKDDHE